MKTPTNPLQLAKDFAALAKKHNLSAARLLPNGDNDVQLVMSKGRVWTYKRQEEWHDVTPKAAPKKIKT